MIVSESDLPAQIDSWELTNFYSKDYNGKAVFQAQYNDTSIDQSKFPIYTIAGGVENNDQVFYVHRGFGRVGPFDSLDKAIDCLKELSQAPGTK
jgi:hypothetical protein